MANQIRCQTFNPERKNFTFTNKTITYKNNRSSMCFMHNVTPFIFRICVTQVCSQILFPTGAAEEVEGKVGATLPFEPDVHVGPGAVVTLPCSTLPTTWMTPLYVVVKLQSKGVAQLTLHHLTAFFSSLMEGE